MARWLIFPLFVSEIKSIYKLLKDKEAKKRYKALVIFGLIYLFSPIDIIPAPIIGLSIVDDCIIWGVILYLLKEPLSKYKDDVKTQKNNKKYKNKNKKIIDVEDFVVVDEDKDKEK